MGWSKNVHEDRKNGEEEFQAFNDIDDIIIEKNYKEYLASGKHEDKRFVILKYETCDFEKMIGYFNDL